MVNSIPFIALAPQYFVMGAIVLVVVLLAAGATMLIRRKRKAPTDTSDSSAPPLANSVEIYAGNLSYDMTDEQLRREFAKYGVVQSARVVEQRGSGKSKGYGFVVMPHRKEAEIAISKLNNREVMGRKLRVNESRMGLERNGRVEADQKSVGRRSGGPRPRRGGAAATGPVRQRQADR